KILSETPPQEQLFGISLKQLASGIRERVVKEVVNWVGQALADYLKAGAGEFVAAADNPADGVTVVVHILNPPGAPLLGKLLHGEGVGVGDLKDIDSVFRGKPKTSVNTVAGFTFD